MRQQQPSPDPAFASRRLLGSHAPRGPKDAPRSVGAWLVTARTTSAALVLARPRAGRWSSASEVWSGCGRPARRRCRLRLSGLLDRLKAAQAADDVRAIINEARLGWWRVFRRYKEVDVADHPIRGIAPALNDGILQRTGELLLKLPARQPFPTEEGRSGRCGLRLSLLGERGTARHRRPTWSGDSFWVKLRRTQIERVESAAPPRVELKRAWRLAAQFHAQWRRLFRTNVWTIRNLRPRYRARVRESSYSTTMHGTLPLSEEQALASLREGTAAGMSLAALAREWGWSRGKLRHRLDGWRKTGDLPQATKPRVIRQKRSTIEAPSASAPDASPSPVAVPMTASAVHVPSGNGRFSRVFGTAILASVGVALAAIGMIETTAYSLRVGGPLFAALAICADALVLFMPPAVAALWRRRSPAMIAAAALWLVGGAVTIANLSGYVASRDDEFTAIRESRSMQRVLALERMERLRTERAAISEMRPVGALNVAIRSVRRSNKPALREAVAIAERRDAVDAELSALAEKLPAIPQIAIIDPSASVLSEISGTNISENSLRRARLMFLLLLPLCGGFVLSVALSLLSAPGTSSSASD